MVGSVIHILHITVDLVLYFNRSNWLSRLRKNWKIERLYKIHTFLNVNENLKPCYFLSFRFCPQHIWVFFFAHQACPSVNIQILNTHHTCTSLRTGGTQDTRNGYDSKYGRYFDSGWRVWKISDSYANYLFTDQTTAPISSFDHLFRYITIYMGLFDFRRGVWPKRNICSW